MPVPPTNNPDDILASKGLAYPDDSKTEPTGWGTGVPQIQDAEKRVGDPENPIDDVWQMSKGLATGVGHVVKGYYDLATDEGKRKEWVNGMSDLFSGKYHKDVGNHLWKGIKEETASHWTDPEGNVDLGYTLWHHPASALMDLAIVKDVVAGGTTMAGKVLGGSSRAMATAEELAKLGQMSKADKLLALGEKIGNTPLDPYQLMGKAVGQIPGVKSLKEELGFGPKGEHKLYDRVAAGNEAEVNTEAQLKKRLLIEGKLGEGSGDRVFNALDRGSREDYAALTPAEADFVDRYKQSQGQFAHDFGGETPNLPNREEYLKKRGYIPEDTKEVLALQGGLREWGPNAWREGKEITEERMAIAKANIESGKWNPTYRFLAHEKDHEFSMLENFGRDLRDEHGPRGQGVGSDLKTRTGMGEAYEKDPMVALMKQTDMQAQFDKRVRLKDKVLELANERGELKVIRDQKDLPPGWKIIPTQAWEQGVIAEKRAAGLALAAEMRGADKMTAAREAMGKFLSDPRTVAPLKDAKMLAVPNYLANWLRFRMGVPSQLARTYDNVFRYWKSLATVLRPNYWANVMGGRGVLAALHNINPMDIAAYIKNRHLLPPEARAIMQTSWAPKGANIFQKSTTNLKNFDALVNVHLARGPGYMHEVEAIRHEVQATAKTLKQTGHDFFVAADTLADRNKFAELTSLAPDQLSKHLQERVILREQLASRSMEVAQKQQEWNEVNRELEAIKADLRSKTTKGPMYDVDLLEPHERTKFNDLADRAVTLNNDIAGLKEQLYKQADREGYLGQKIPELQRVADWADKAIEPINQLDGSYLRMHPLERQWISRAIPFYPWAKAMAKLVFQLPFAYPKQTFMWNRYAAVMNDLTSHDEKVPEWLQGAIAVGHTQDGSTVYVRPFWNPFAGEKPVKIGGITTPGIVGNVLQRHPLLKVAHDLLGGVDTFTMKPWSTDETMTRMDTGEVFKMDMKTGEWVRTMAQPSLWRRLWGLFPESQMVDALFLPHVQSDKGWIGHPDPLMVKGTPIQVPFMQRMAHTLLPVSFQSEDQKGMAEMKQNRIYKQYIKEIRHMNPEEQETAMKVLEDASRVRR